VIVVQSAEEGNGVQRKEPQTVRATTRALSILSAMKPSGTLLTDLAAEASLSVPTTFRLLRTLEESEFVTRDSDGKYYVGPAILRLAYMADTGGGARWLVRQGVEALAAECNETCAFSILSGLRRLRIESVESTKSIRWVAKAGTTGPLHLGAAGKVFLAFGPTETLLESIATDDGIFQLAAGKQRTLDDLRAELDVIRQERVASSKQETTRDSWGIAAPVFVSGRLLGVIGIAIPMDRYSAQNERDLMKMCRDSAETLSSAASTSAFVQ
jgi:DNA-binding IclR family transcriptional regulator